MVEVDAVIIAMSARSVPRDGGQGSYLPVPLKCSVTDVMIDPIRRISPIFRCRCGSCLT
jgi:hypothetical protein